MQNLINDRRAGEGFSLANWWRRSSQNPIHLNENTMVSLWTSDLVPQWVESLFQNIDISKRVFEVIVKKMLGSNGANEAGKWKLWSHIYTAMHEREYLKDCRAMIAKPVMIFENEEQKDLLRGLAGRGQYFVSAGDIGEGSQKRSQKGDFILQEWIDKFYAVSLGLAYFLPTNSHYPEIYIQKMIAGIIATGQRNDGESDLEYRNRLGENVSDLKGAMESIGYRPSILGK